MFATYINKPLGNGRGGDRERDEPTELIVCHTSEPGSGHEDLLMDDRLAAFLGTPATATNKASYHLSASQNKTMFRYMDDKLRPHGAGGGNDQGLHFCIPGTRFQTPEQWVDPITMDFLISAANACADWVEKYDIPIRKLTVQQVRNHERGFCDHNDVSLAFGLSDHTDPGPNFPWNFFLSTVNNLVNPPLPKPTHKRTGNMFRACKLEDSSFWYGNGEDSWNWPPPDAKEADLILAEGLLDVKTERVVHSWDEVHVIIPRRRNKYVGKPVL